MRLPVTIALPAPIVCLRRTGRLRPVALTLRKDGLLDVLHAGGDLATCSVHPHTTVFPWLIVLLYRVDRRVRSLVLPRFAFDAADHRRLRLWLRWKATT